MDKGSPELRMRQNIFVEVRITVRSIESQWLLHDESHLNTNLSMLQPGFSVVPGP